MGRFVSSLRRTRPIPLAGQRSRGRAVGCGRKISAIVAACAVAVAVSACGPPVQAVRGSTWCANGGAAPADAVTSVIYNRVNADRGVLGGLSWNAQLACLALEWSAQLGSSGAFFHRDLNAVLSSPAYRGWHTLGENLLRGPASMSGDAIEDSFMNSPAHRDNILSPAFNSVGVGISYTPDGRVYVTQNFGG
jgi:uncharacterized protein YkwD